MAGGVALKLSVAAPHVQPYHDLVNAKPPDGPRRANEDAAILPARDRGRTTSEVRESDADIARGDRHADDLQRGDLLADKYRLRRRLGVGGMGSVWVAHDEALDIDVALKVIRADVRQAASTHTADRLLQEARAAAKLGHPAIVRISDFGKTSRGAPFVVMELLAGEDLATALDRRGRISAAKAVRSLLPIAHALVAAHDKGIVHRDLKPENIFLARADDGSVQPKLIDFGVAKLQKKASERLTAVGAVMGSPGYMPPEQARGDDVDARADVWSLCVVLYEMLTGRLPFKGKNYHALLRSIIDDEAPPLSDMGVGDEDLWAIIARGLTKKLDDRWPSMRDLGAALADWLMLRGSTEDICGSSLITAWMVERRPNAGVDAFESVPPPRMRDELSDSGSGSLRAAGGQTKATASSRAGGGGVAPADSVSEPVDSHSLSGALPAAVPSSSRRWPAIAWRVGAAVVVLAVGALGARAVVSAGSRASEPAGAASGPVRHGAPSVRIESAPLPSTAVPDAAISARADSATTVSAASAVVPPIALSTRPRAARPAAPPVSAKPSRPAPAHKANQSRPPTTTTTATLKRPTF